MVILRFRNDSDAKDLLQKLKKMHKFTKELMDCVEDKYDEEYDEEEDYRYDDEDDRLGRMKKSAAYRSRYRRSM